jgi:Dynein heavy chain, N-terminal region 2
VYELIFSRLLKEHLPTISTLCNPGIRDRHWEKMTEIFGRNLKPDTGTSLRKVLQYGLEPYMDQFEVVSAGASKVRRNEIDDGIVDAILRRRNSPWKKH